jgi:DNA-directed RNA polymerase specialized sigma24 family protein
MRPRTFMESPTPTSSALGIRFEQTLWSEVMAAGQAGNPDSARALERLCRVYWYPIYAYLRRRGFDPHQAKDFTQGFFYYLLKKNLVQTAAPEKGRFRSFLLGSLKNFISNEEARERAIKRGGDRQLVSLDEEVAEGRYIHEPKDERSPERLFDQRWALAVLDEAARRLEKEFYSAGMETEFTELKSFLNSNNGLPYQELATRLHRTEVGLRSIVSRMRRRFRELLLDVIRETVADPAQVQAEMDHLKSALRDG